MALKRYYPYFTARVERCPASRAGVGVSDEALGVIPVEAASSADLGGSSKYSNENFED